MPSKAKKQSKSQSRLANSEKSPASSSDFEASSEEDIARCIEEASAKFPSLIGKSALIGRVTDVEPQSKSCTIWLSEPSMVASSLTPGSIVSVSLCSSRKEFSNGFPLSSLTDECAAHFGIDFGDKTTGEVGNYFALATVFPSLKVLKNGVRLSSNLSYTIGCPASGRVVFVYPIQSQLLTGLGNGFDKKQSGGVNCLSLYNCRELYLELAPCKNRRRMSSNMSSPMNSQAEKTHDQVENVMSLSPKTPLHRSKLSFSNSCQLTSPICEKSRSSLHNYNSVSGNSIDISEVLEDESSKKLMQSCATSWLYSRSLVPGNLVGIPILSELCIFRVIGANGVTADSTTQDWAGEGSHSLPLQAFESVDHMNYASVVDSETKVYMHLRSDSASEIQQKRGFPGVQLVCNDVEANAGGETIKLGGLSKEYAILKDIISSLTKDTLSRFGLRPAKGVLLHGPPGTGKTSLACLCAHDSGVNLFTVNGPEIVKQYHGESEQALRDVFDSASRAAPAVVFIDELDSIAPARKDGGEELSQRMVATLLDLMDGISRTDGILVIAATNSPDYIDPALRRPGRLDKEIEIGVPSPKQRLDILLAILSRREHSLSEMQVRDIALAAHGFVGSDLAGLCREAGLICVRRHVKFKKSCDDLLSSRASIAYEDYSHGVMEGPHCSKDIKDLLRDCSDSASSFSELPVSLEVLPAFRLCKTVPESADNIQNDVGISCNGTCLTEDGQMLKISFEDFEKARMKIRPSAMREVLLEIPKVNWEDVGGQKEVKTQLIEAVEWPQKHQDAFKRIGIHPPTGVLMFGPPGCSKTLMARAVASEAGLNFLAVKGPELLSKWVGESEKAVRSLFAKARANAPSIVFFDEIDGLAVIRGKDGEALSVADRVMSQLLVELDGLRQRVDVTVIAATNRPDKIDPALLRPGRFDRLLYVGSPNENDRKDIFSIHLRKTPCSSDVSMRELAFLTKGCTGADISLICQEASIAALEENIAASEITMEHLKIAIRQVQPTEIQGYEGLSSKFQRLVRSSATGDESGNQRCSGS